MGAGIGMSIESVTKGPGIQSAQVPEKMLCADGAQILQCRMVPEMAVESTLKGHFPGYSFTPVDVGGFKLVYRMEGPDGSQAMKVVPIMGDPNEELFIAEQISRVEREVRALAECASPYVVKLGTVPMSEVEISGHRCVYYSEEFLAGDTLFSKIQTEPVPGEEAIRLLLRCLLLAVKDLWAGGYVHRDIKPKNIMATGEKDRPFVLLDLGIAFSVRETALTFAADQRLPPATYRYIAPEMLLPDFRASLDYRADLYTIGLTAFEFSAQAHPLARNGDDLVQTVSRALRQQPKRLQDHRGDLSPQLCNLINQMIKKKPALRPGNIDRIVEQLAVHT